MTEEHDVSTKSAWAFLVQLKVGFNPPRFGAQDLASWLELSRKIGGMPVVENFAMQYSTEKIQQSFEEIQIKWPFCLFDHWVSVLLFYTILQTGVIIYLALNFFIEFMKIVSFLLSAVFHFNVYTTWKLIHICLLSWQAPAMKV